VWFGAGLQFYGVVDEFLCFCVSVWCLGVLVLGVVFWFFVICLL